MRSTPVKPGSIVESRMGRDAGRRFLVIGELDENFVQVADGKLRKMDRLKKKRRRHLTWVGECASLKERLDAGRPVEDHEVRKWLFDEEE